MKQLKRILSVSLSVVLLIQLISGNQLIFAAEQDGFTVTHELQENKTGDVQVGNFIEGPVTRTLGERVVSKLSYSTAGVTTTFSDVVISYVLPPGTTYLPGDSIYSGHVKTTSYNSGTRRLDITLSNDNDTNVFDAGKSGELFIAFQFNNPSPYPDGSVINLDESVINYKSNDVAKSFNLDGRSVNYTLVDSWSITKTPDATLTIPSDPTVLTISEDYTIRLDGGNINLKNVLVVDSLPDHVVSASASGGGVVDIPGKTITWTLADLTAGAATDLTASLTYTIDRDGDGNNDGVADGRTRLNQVSVTGEKITTNASNVQVSSGQQQVFIQDSDSATTTFERSSAIWTLELSADSTESLPPKASITTYDVDYQIKLSGGDITLKDAQIVYTLPPSVSAVPDADGGVVSALDPVDGASSGNITWDIETLNVGTHTCDLTLTYNIDRDGDGDDDGVLAGRHRDHTATITSNEINAEGGSGPAYVFLQDTDTVRTDFIDMNIWWDANKVTRSGVSGGNKYYLPFINADQDSGNITYRLSLDTFVDGSKTGVEYNVPIKTVTFTDDLPDYAVYVSHSSNATVDGFVATNNPGELLTFNLIDIGDNTNPYVDVTVKYLIDGDQSGDGVDPEGTNTQTNAYTVSNPKDGNGDPVAITGDTTAGVTVTFEKSSEPAPSVSIEIQGYNKYNGAYNPANYNSLNPSTYPGDKNYELGDTITYVVDIVNNGNGKDLLGSNKTYLDIGTLPAVLDYASISLGSSSDAVGYNVVLSTFDISEGVPGIINRGPYNTDTLETITIGDLGLDADEYITDIQILYTDDVPNGFTYDISDILITGTVNSSYISETDYANDVQLSYRFMEFGGADSAEKTDTDDVWFRVLDAFGWISFLNKTDLTNAASYQTNGSVQFGIDFRTDSKLATDDVVGLKIIDVVPVAFDIDSLDWNDGADWTNDNPGISEPTMTVYNDFPSQGKNTVVWAWAEDYQFPEGSSLDIIYDLDFYSYAGIGNYTNEVYAVAENAYFWNSGLSQENDDEDLDHDVDTGLRLVGNPDTVTIIETAAVGSQVWVKGELDADYSRYPDVGRTTPGGFVDYRIKIVNDGNVPVDNVVVVDILPFAGDTAVMTPANPRGSLWGPFMIEAISPGEQVIVEDRDGNTSKVNLTVEYSKASDPIRSNLMNNGTIGSEEPKWTTTPPEDLSEVRSIRLTFDNFKTLADGAKELEAGEIATVDVKLRAPVSAPPSSNPGEVDPDLQEAAWNSIGMTADRNGNTLLWNEPLKVGVIVENHSLGEIGNFVWFDYNGDGQQNDGYDEENAGLNGITAILYNDEDVEVDRTITGDDHFGKPGYYLFPNLVSDDYYVVFELPTYYKITSDRTGSSETDSNGFDDGGTIKTHMITINTAGAGLDVINHTIDLGVVDNDKLVEATISKDSTGYDPVAGGPVNFGGTKVPVNIGETVFYTIVVENTGQVPLTNVEIVDQGPNATFSFTKATHVLSDHSTIAYDDFTADPNADKTASNKVVLNKLGVGESYELYGQYIVQEADVNGNPLVNIAKLYANELKDKTDDSEYASDDDSLDIAGFEIDKKLTHINSLGLGTFESVADDAMVRLDDQLRYTIKVTNTGSVDLTNVRVTDAKTGLDTTIVSIPVGESKSVTTEYTVTLADEGLGHVDNTAIASDDVIREDVSDDHSTDFLPDGMAVIKNVVQVNGLAPEILDGKVIARLGDTITYEIRVINTQDALSLTNVTLVDDNLTSTKNNGAIQNLLSGELLDDDLPAGELVTKTLDYLVTVEDFGDPTSRIINTVGVQSDEIAEKRDSIEVELVGLAIEKTADRSYFRRVGDIITYTIAVTNTGSIDLDNVVVTDAKLIINETIPSLAAGDTYTISEDYTVTIEDMENREIINTASAENPVIGPVDDQVTTPYRSAPLVIPEPEPEPEVIPEPDPQPEPQPEPEYEREPGPLSPEEKPTDIPEEIIYKPTVEVKNPEVSKPPTKGEVEIKEDGSIVYKPGDDFDGSDSFTITIETEDGDMEITIDVFEDIPEGITELPESGGVPLPAYILVGGLISGSGLRLRRKKKK